MTNVNEVSAFDAGEQDNKFLRDYISQYKNPDLCAKWDNNIPADELEFLNEYTDLSQGIEELYRYFPFLPVTNLDDEQEFIIIPCVTGIKYTLGDGDYEEVYVTESSRPYSLDAIYHPLDYYLD